MKNVSKVILASSSPRRKDILNMLGIRFETLSPDIDESGTAGDSAGLVEEISLKKAEAAVKLCREKGIDTEDALIIACDTVVDYNGNAIGKPADAAEAELMLELLSDSWHTVYSGLTLVYNGALICESAATRVKFFKLSHETVTDYIESGEPFGKAGAYAVQGLGAALVETISGEYYNIVGMPVSLFEKMLNELLGIGIFALRKL